jgi:hypothetical protein
MSSFVSFGSRQISLAERSRSSFAPIVFILCAGEDLPPSSCDADEGYQWEIQLMRAGFPTGTRRCRSYEEAHSLLGRIVYAYRER